MLNFRFKPFSTLVEDEKSVKTDELEDDTEILPGSFLKVRLHQPKAKNFFDIFSVISDLFCFRLV